MRAKHILLAMAAIAFVLLSGCASVNYWQDRAKDAADIFTASVGLGGGAKARVGPVHAGLFANYDAAGLRGGDFGSFDLGSAVFPSTVELETTLVSLHWFTDTGGDAKWRGKHFEAFGVVGLAAPMGHNGISLKPVSFYTQVEAAAGLVGTLRLGVNPGEFLDFLLGWTTLDIFNDDLGRIEMRRILDELEREKASKDLSGEEGASPPTE